jgi:hypothetical protein
MLFEHLGLDIGTASTVWSSGDALVLGTPYLILFDLGMATLSIDVCATF